MPLPQEEHAIDRVAWTIWNAPPGTLAHAAGRLEELAQTQGRRRVAYYAIARLADAGEDEAPYLGRLVRSYKDWDARPTEDDRKLVMGALMGLCRLGGQGNWQRQLVIDLLKDGRQPGSKVDSLAHAGMVALLEMGAAPELDTIFSGQPDLRALARRTWEQMKVTKWNCLVG